MHDRMPLVLGEADWDRWLDPDAPAPADLLAAPPDTATMAMREVSTSGQQRRQQRTGTHRTGRARQPTGRSVLSERGGDSIATQPLTRPGGTVDDRSGTQDRHHHGAQPRRPARWPARCPSTAPRTVAAKARELRLFQPEWEAIGPRGRKKWMLKWQEWILDNADHITEVLMSETGKSRVDANIEPIAVADVINYWAGPRRGVPGRQARLGAHPAVPGQEVHHASTGRSRWSASSRPWNFPFAMPGLDVPPALAAGARCCSSRPR